MRPHFKNNHLNVYTLMLRPWLLNLDLAARWLTRLVAIKLYQLPPDRPLVSLRISTGPIRKLSVFITGSRNWLYFHRRLSGLGLMRWGQDVLGILIGLNEYRYLLVPRFYIFYYLEDWESLENIFLRANVRHLNSHAPCINAFPSPTQSDKYNVFPVSVVNECLFI